MIEGPTAALRNGAIFLLALFGGCVIMRAALPFPRIAPVRDKLEAFASAGPCNVAFFGTSKIYSGIIPEQFDAALQQRGLAVRSYNFGVDGMGFPESGYFCEQVLARYPGQLRWIFIEANSVRTDVPELHLGTRRLIYWHDARSTLAICRAILAGYKPERRAGASPANLLFIHAGAFFWRVANVGDAAEVLLEQLLPLRKQKRNWRDRVDKTERGYLALHAFINETDAARVVKDVRAFRGRPRRPASAVNDQILLEFAQRVADRGAQVIFLTSPNPVPSREMFTANSAAAPPVFAFDDPERWPRFYEPGFRCDYAHLNHRGAQEFTALVAEQFAELVNSTRP